MSKYKCPILSEIHEALLETGIEEDAGWCDGLEALITFGANENLLDDYELVDRYEGGDYMNALYTVFMWKGVMYKVDYYEISHSGIEFDTWNKAYPVTQKTKEVFYYE